MKITNEEREILALEIIRYLQTWGLWQDVWIYTNGNMYSYSDDKKMTYGGLEYVEFTEDANPEYYMTRTIWKKNNDGSMIRECESFANPDHIFDMVYPGPLYELVRYLTYDPEISKISDEAWEYIFKNTDIVLDFIEEEYGVRSPEELAEQMWSDIFDNPELSYWDPVEFDTWQEYLDLVGGDIGSNLALMSFDTYEEYCQFRDEGREYFILEQSKKIKELWNAMVEWAKKQIRKCARDEKCYIKNIMKRVSEEVQGYVLNGFDGIFERHDLWYEICYDDSLTCYRI